MSSSTVSPDGANDRGAADQPAGTTAPSASAATPSDAAAPSRLVAIELVPLVAGLEKTTNVTHAGDDRLFAVSQLGAVWIVRDGEVQDRPFLDISDRTEMSASERGLLDVAFHPDHASNGRFYVNYTDRNGATVVSELEVRADDPDRAVPDSERVILRVDQPFRNHNGGHIEFGPDGHLYIAMGDGGSSGDPFRNGQNTETLLGAILRIDVDGEQPYAIPPDNPFVGIDGVRDEIWAYGVRNPWGFSFDELTGELWFADVGQDRWEEVNLAAAGTGGQNYGWNVVEANSCFEAVDCDTAGLTAPVFAYSHDDGRCSVTGGRVYRGSAHPEMQGVYFFGDFCVGVVWATTQAADGTWETGEVARASISTAAFGADADGNLYLADRLDDVLYRLQPAS